MSWSVSGRFTSPVLDIAALRAACEAVGVAKQVRVEIRDYDPALVTCFFTIAGGRVRGWESTGWMRARELDEIWAQHGYREGTDVPIEIQFISIPASEGEPGWALMSFDTAHSGNAICSTIGQELLNAIGDRLGVECKADF